MKKGVTKAAAGAEGVFVALRHTAAEAGILRGIKALSNLNQKDGFDCPGCAWPEPEDRSHAEFCENGAKAVAHEATRKRADAAFFAQHSITSLRERSHQWLEAQGRLVTPLYRAPGSDHYEAISWDDATERIAAKLRSLQTPNEAVFYTSGRTSNEAAFLYQLFVRAFGTNNLPDCSNMCHESSGTALGEVLGIGKGTVGLHDFYLTQAIFVLGQNPGTNHPRMLSALQKAKENGAKIVVINPLRERGLVRFSNPQRPTQLLGGSTEIADLYLQVRVGGDIALLKGIAKLLFEQESLTPGSVVDHEFIEQHCEGFDTYRRAIESESMAELEEKSGISRAAMAEAAQIYSDSKATIACWAMGLTQHRHGVANIREVTNLLLLAGNMGKPGAGACPVRGHSNVQGDRTMGIWEKPAPDFLDRLDNEFAISSPREHGLDTIAALQAMEAGKVRVFFALGGNFAAASPDTHRSEAALANCEMTVHVATKLNRGHITMGSEALVLPCLGRSEQDHQSTGPQFVTVEDSMSVVHASRGSLKPADAELHSEPAIVCALAEAVVGSTSQLKWKDWASDYNLVRNRIARVIPGFESFNERLRQEGSFVLPNGPRDRNFTNSQQRALFSINETPDETLKPGEFLLMTIRSHDQFNTTVYSDNDRYRGIHGERAVLFINPDDIEALGFGDPSNLDPSLRVDLSNGNGETTRVLRGLRPVPYEIPRRCMATYFPEANVLVALEDFAEGSRTPAYKSIAVTITATITAAQSRQ